MAATNPIPVKADIDTDAGGSARDEMRLRVGQKTFPRSNGATGPGSAASSQIAGTKVAGSTSITGGTS